MSRLAIIDIGSNAIRTVVYEDDSLGAPEIFNEKFKSDILNLLESQNLDIKHQTYLCFKYLVHIFNKLSVTHIKCVATAVLRKHPRATEFQNIIKTKYNIDIEIISGEQEAYLTATGLILGIERAAGIVADLGGGSLELATIQNSTVEHPKSFPLGTKIITKHCFSSKEIIKLIENEYLEHYCENLYLIGGAFRFIGRYYMEFAHHPLRNLHNFEISSQDFALYLDKLEQIHHIRPKFDSKRIDYNAILVAKALLQVLSPKKIVISNYGLKEGVRFVNLSQVEQQKNVIYERTKRLIDFNQDTCEIKEYSKLITKLLIDPDDVIVEIVHLAIILAQFNKSVDRTLRANFTLEFILSSDIPFSYRQRLILCLILTYLYNAKFDIHISRIAKKILTKVDIGNSQIIGNFIKIAQQVDGPEFFSPSFSLNLRNEFIEIVTTSILPRSIFDKICERIKDISYTRKYLLAQH